MKSRQITPDDNLGLPENWMAVSFSAPGTMAFVGNTIPKTVKILAVAPAETAAQMESAAPDQLFSMLIEGGGRPQTLPNKATGELIPSVLAIYPDNSTSQQYHSAGRLHRDDGEPAEILQAGDGTVVKERYFMNGVLHRDGDEPAVIHYFAKSGAKSREDYYHNGLRHRENGPASIGYTPDGKKVSETHYVNGSYVPPEPEPEQAEVYEFSPAEPTKVDTKPAAPSTTSFIPQTVAPPPPMPKAPPVIMPAAPAVSPEALAVSTDQMALF